MTTDTILTKRRALYKGEVGLFADNEMAEADLALATMNTEVICRWYSPRAGEAIVRHAAAIEQFERQHASALALVPVGLS